MATQVPYTELGILRTLDECVSEFTMLDMETKLKDLTKSLAQQWGYAYVEDQGWQKIDVDWSGCITAKDEPKSGGGGAGGYIFIKAAWHPCPDHYSADQVIVEYAKRRDGKKKMVRCMEPGCRYESEYKENVRDKS